MKRWTLRSVPVGAGVLVLATIGTAFGDATKADAGSVGLTKDQCIAANGQAQSLRREGKFALARAQLATCLDARCPKLVSADCATRLDELDRAQPTILFEVEDAAGHDVVDVRLGVDGQPLAARLDGTAVSVDPGQHEFTFEAEGKPATTQTLLIREQEKGRRERIALGPPAIAAASVTTTAVPIATDTAQPTHSMRRTVGLVVGAVGVAAAATGAVFGVLASSAKSDYEQHCGSSIHQPSGACDPTGITGHADASTKATLSTAFFIGGGVAVAAGAVLFLTAPKVGATTVGVGPGSVVVSGRF